MRRLGDESILWRLLEGSPSQWAGLLIALAVIFVLVVVSIRIRAWFREDADPRVAEQQMLSRIGDLRRQGDLTEAEYRSIKSQLIERLEGTASAGKPRPGPDQTDT